MTSALAPNHLDLTDFKSQLRILAVEAAVDLANLS